MDIKERIKEFNHKYQKIPKPVHNLSSEVTVGNDMVGYLLSREPESNYDYMVCHIIQHQWVHGKPKPNCFGRVYLGQYQPNAPIYYQEKLRKVNVLDRDTNETLLLEMKYIISKHFKN